MKSASPIEYKDIKDAEARLSDCVRTTPVNHSSTLSKVAGVPVFLKLEHHQLTGSFKLRGASNAILSLAQPERDRGVVGVSTGNHGRGLAQAARKNGVRCIVCMSNLVPENKIAGIKAEGAEVRLIGNSQDDAQVEVDRLIEQEGMTLVPPFDNRDVIAGQGTVGLEIERQVQDIDTVLVPVSGGGLISGIAAALKTSHPHIRIVGVSMQRGAAMHQCLNAGKPIQVEELETLADSLGGGIGLDNRYTFEMVRELVDDVVLVSELEIAKAIRHAYWKEYQIIEGSGSVGIAALLAQRVRPNGTTVCITSGGNINMKLHHRIISGEDVDVTNRDKDSA